MIKQSLIKNQHHPWSLQGLFVFRIQSSHRSNHIALCNHAKVKICSEIVYSSGIILTSVWKYSGYITSNKNKEQNIELLELKHMGVIHAKLKREKEKSSSQAWPSWPQIIRPQTNIFLTNSSAPSPIHAHSVGTIYKPQLCNILLLSGHLCFISPLFAYKTIRKHLKTKGRD